MTDFSFRLGDLIPGGFHGAEAERAIAMVSADSRKIGPGGLFFALSGSKADGRAFVADAVAKGAAAIAGEFTRPDDLPDSVAYVMLHDARRTLALTAARIHPRQPETIVAITGTSGNSSVADFTRQIFAHLGRNSASLGTIGVITASGASYGSLTTPDPLTLHQTLDRLAADGVSHLAMEASSHGLDQRRLDGVHLSAGAFLNLGRDHLDYHPSVEDYLAAKLRLFDLLPQGAPAVINADGAYAEEALGYSGLADRPVITVGRKGRTLKLLDVQREGFAQRLTVEAAGEEYPMLLPLAGDFQAGNALVAAALVMAVGEDRAATLALLPRLVTVPGRLERVGEARGGLAIVDYAHKPDALAAVLATLRPYAAGRLICVFGCGGDRDRGKRPIMGEIAAKGADVAIITDDNPRSEAPAAIRGEILTGAKGPAQVVEIGDRAEAIQAAVRMLGAGDVLVVAGKGHETGQIVGDRVLPFSDRDAVAAAIAELA